MVEQWNRFFPWQYKIMDRIVAVVVCFINTVINRLNSLPWNWKSSLSFNMIFLRNTTQNPCNGNVQAHTSTTRLKFYYWQKIDIRTLKIRESNSQVQRIVCMFFSSDIYDGSLKQVTVTMQAPKRGWPYAVSGKIIQKGHCCLIFRGAQLLWKDTTLWQGSFNLWITWCFAKCYSHNHQARPPLFHKWRKRSWERPWLVQDQRGDYMTVTNVP